MKKILTLMLLVLMVFSLGACSSEKPANEEDNTSSLTEVKDVTVGEFTIDICGAVISNKDLENCSLYSGVANTTNSQGNSSSREYVGYKLLDVFKIAQVEAGNNAVQIVCSDGFEASYEGVIDDSVLLAITKDGETFKDGPWFAPLTSKTTGDFAQDVVKIGIGDVVSSLAKDTKEETKEEEKEEIAFPQDPVVEDKTDKINFGDYCFKINGQDVVNADLEGLTIYRITVVTKNSKDIVSQSKYSGYVLKDVFAKLGISANKVKTIAADNYEAELSEELINSDLTIIAIEKDKEVGKDGTIWLAPCSETKSGAYAKEVVEIIAE